MTPRGAVTESLRTLRGRSSRYIATLVMGTASAQFITLAAIPFLTRLYSPEAIGLAGTFLAIAAIVTPVAALCYPLAIALPRHHNQAFAISLHALRLGGLLAVLGFLLILLGYPWLKEHPSMPGNWTLILPALMVLAVCRQILEQWSHRLSLFKVSAKVSASYSLLINSGKVLGGLVAPLAGTLIGVTLIAEFFACALYAFWLRRSGQLPAKPADLSLRSSLKVVRAYGDFPIYRAPQVLISSMALGVPVLLLGMAYGAAAVGFYVLARQVVAAPVTLVGKAVNDVLYPRLAKATHAGEALYPLLARAMGLLTVVGLLPMVALMLEAPAGFEFLLGEDWGTAGHYARWLALWFFTTLITMPCVAALPVLGMQRFHLFYTCCTVLLRLGLFYALIDIWSVSDLTAVALFCASGAVTNLLLAALVSRRARRAVPPQDDPTGTPTGRPSATAD